MIPQSVLIDLTPSEEPDTPIPGRLSASLDGAPDFQRRLTLWAEAARTALREVVLDDQILDARLQKASGIGFGIFETASTTVEDVSGFPNIGGYQFGIGLFNASFQDDEKEERSTIPVAGGRYSIPILEFQVEYLPHRGGAEGFPAVHCQVDGEACAITAGHVVGNTRPGRKVPLVCKDCGADAVLMRRPLPLIDAVQIKFPCGGPIFPYRRPPDDAHTLPRFARKGETVELHLGESGLRRGSVMNDISDYAEFMSGAAPIIVMVDEFGSHGDSGSLISSVFSDTQQRDALSMYLGETVAKDKSGHMKRCCYSLDMTQLTTVMGIRTPIYGEFL